MARYGDLTSAVDPSLVVTEENLLEADVDVDAALWERGINPDSVSLPQALLTNLANKYALRAAANNGAIGENSPLIAKAKEFERDAARLAKGISRESLGLTVEPGSGFGTVTLGRA